MNDKEKLEAIEWEMSFIYDELKLFDEEGFKQDSNSFLFRQTSRKEHRSLKTEWKILYRIREITRKMTQTDKEKIEKALDHIDHFLAYRDKVKGSKRLPILRSDITNIKSILETGKLPDYGFDET